MSIPRQSLLGRSSAGRTGAYTVVEVSIALVILLAFLLTSTFALNFFDNWAAKNRNGEAARAIVDDYVNYLLSDSTVAPAATSTGTDIDGDGIPDGVICTQIGSRYVPGPTASAATGTVPLIVTRTTAGAPVVTGTLYWNVQAVGASYNLNAPTDLMQINFLLAYVYRGKAYYYKATTFKGSTT